MGVSQWVATKMRPQPKSFLIPRGQQGYADGGVMDFGREHVYIDNETGIEFVIPTALVNHIRSEKQQ